MQTTGLQSRFLLKDPDDQVRPAVRYFHFPFSLISANVANNACEQHLLRPSPPRSHDYSAHASLARHGGERRSEVKVSAGQRRGRIRKCGGDPELERSSVALTLDHSTQ